MKNVTFKTRHALVLSCISLMTCFAMLLGTTFAWFTDSVTSGVNRIVAGNLDVEVYHKTSGTANPEEKVDGTTKLFTKDINGKDLLWEPEVIAYETFKVSNVGSLALKYAMTLNNVGYNTVKGTSRALTDVIKVAVTTSAPADRTAAQALTYDKTLGQFINNPVGLPTGLGSISAGTTDPQEFTIVLYWPQDSAIDNNYNLGNINGVKVESSDGQPLYVNLGITLVATQVESEFDSFSNTYDASANTADVEDKWAGVAVASAAPTLTATTDNGVTTTTATTTVAAAPTIDTAKQTTVTLTAVSSDTDAAFNENSKLNLKVETNDVKASSSSTAFTVSDGSTAVASIDLTLTKITTTTTSGSGTSITETQLTSGFTSIIDTYVATGLNDPKVAYNGDASLAFGKNKAGTKVNAQEDVDAVGEYWYDSATGHLVFMTDHYSQYYVTTQDVAYIAETDTAYQTLPEACIAAAAAEGDVVVTLLRDAKGDGWSPDNAQTGTYTLDFAGHTYDVTGLVGSTNTRTQAWRVISGQTATLKNGTLTSSYAYMLINQYGNLTLDNMIVDGSKMPLYPYSDGTFNYTLSNNSGTTTIKNGTVIKVVNNGHAFDVYGSYSGKSKTINVIVKDGVINGIVEFDKGNGSNSSLNISGGDFTNATFAGLEAGVRVSITGGTFDHDPNPYVADGYIGVPNETYTSWTVHETWNKYADKNGLTINEESKTISVTTAAGLAYFNAHAAEYANYTVTLQNDINLTGHIWTPIKGVRYITFDGANHTISNMTAASLNGKDVALFHSIYGSTVKDLVIDNATAIGINRISGIVAYHNSGVVDNCTVKNSTFTACVYKNDDGDKVAAISGLFIGEPSAGMKNCKVENVTLTGYRDTGSLAGYVGCYGNEFNVHSTPETCYITDNTVSNVTINNVKSPNYKNYSEDNQYDVNELVGDSTSDNWSNTYRKYSGNTCTNVTINRIV